MLYPINQSACPLWMKNLKLCTSNPDKYEKIILTISLVVGILLIAIAAVLLAGSPLSSACLGGLTVIEALGFGLTILSIVLLYRQCTIKPTPPMLSENEKQLEEDNKNLRIDNTDLKQTLFLKKEQQTASNTKIQKLDTTINEKHAEITSLQEQLAQLTTSITSLEAEKQQLNSKIQENLSLTKEQQEISDARIQELNTTIDSKNTEITSLQKQLAQLTTSVTSLENEKQQLSRQVQQLQASLTTKTRTVLGLQKTVTELKMHIDNPESGISQPTDTCVEKSNLLMKYQNLQQQFITLSLKYKEECKHFDLIQNLLEIARDQIPFKEEDEDEEKASVISTIATAEQQASLIKNSKEALQTLKKALKEHQETQKSMALAQKTFSKIEEQCEAVQNLHPSLQKLNQYMESLENSKLACKQSFDKISHQLQLAYLKKQQIRQKVRKEFNVRRDGAFPRTAAINSLYEQRDALQKEIYQLEHSKNAHWKMFMTKTELLAQTKQSLYETADSLNLSIFKKLQEAELEVTKTQKAEKEAHIAYYRLKDSLAQKFFLEVVSSDEDEESSLN